MKKYTKLWNSDATSNLTLEDGILHILTKKTSNIGYVWYLLSLNLKNKPHLIVLNIFFFVFSHQLQTFVTSLRFKYKDGAIKKKSRNCWKSSIKRAYYSLLWFQRSHQIGYIKYFVKQCIPWWSLVVHYSRFSKVWNF